MYHAISHCRTMDKAYHWLPLGNIWTYCEYLLHMLRPWHTECKFVAILTSQIHRDIALDLLQCYFNGPIHTGSIFLLWIHGNFLSHDFFALDPFYHMIFVQFCGATALTAVCFTTCMIQHMLSILIYILINLPWIAGKQQQHCFSIEGKSIVGIGYTQLKIKVASSLVNSTHFIKIWGSIQIDSTPTTRWVWISVIAFLLKLSI